MRPLPIEAVAGAPAFVRGVAVVRGAPIAVVDPARLLGGSEGRAARLLSLRAGTRRIGLLVDEVVGVQAIPAESLGALPPLLADADEDAVSALGTLDGELLLVLESARLVAAAGELVP